MMSLDYVWHIAFIVVIVLIVLWLIYVILQILLLIGVGIVLLIDDRRWKRDLRKRDQEYKEKMQRLWHGDDEPS